MATLYSTEGAKQNDPTAKNLLNGGVSQANVVYGKASYVATTALAANDVIRMFKIPEGYTPIADSFVLSTDGVAATTCTAKLGTDLDTDAFIASAEDLNSAAVVSPLTATTAGAEVTTPVTANVAAGGWVVVEIAALTGTATAGKVINVYGTFAKA